MPRNLNYPPVAKIPPQILSTMKMNDNVAYAAFPKELKGRRNMVTLAAQQINARFISGKSQEDDVSRL
jgi:PAB-dependent poly(A)-specific ribonuclease subunit 2